SIGGRFHGSIERRLHGSIDRRLHGSVWISAAAFRVWSRHDDGWSSSFGSTVRENYSVESLQCKRSRNGMEYNSCDLRCRRYESRCNQHELLAVTKLQDRAARRTV